MPLTTPILQALASVRPLTLANPKQAVVAGRDPVEILLGNDVAIENITRRLLDYDEVGQVRLAAALVAASHLAPAALTGAVRAAGRMAEATGDGRLTAAALVAWPLAAGGIAEATVAAWGAAGLLAGGVAGLAASGAELVQLRVKAQGLLWDAVTGTAGAAGAAGAAGGGDGGGGRLRAGEASAVQDMLLSAALDWRLAVLPLASHADALREAIACAEGISPWPHSPGAQGAGPSAEPPPPLPPRPLEPKSGQQAAAIAAVTAAEDAAAARLATGLARAALDVWAPLAHRLGLHGLKNDLEELAFRQLWPAEHALVVDAVGVRHAAFEPLLVEAVRRLRLALERDPVFSGAVRAVAFEARSKSPYSVWRKARRILRARRAVEWCGEVTAGKEADVSLLAEEEDVVRRALDSVLDGLAVRVVFEPAWPEGILATSRLLTGLGRIPHVGPDVARGRGTDAVQAAADMFAPVEGRWRRRRRRRRGLAGGRFLDLRGLGDVLCYRALAVVRSLAYHEDDAGPGGSCSGGEQGYREMKLRDYVAHPKANGYRSLHATVALLDDSDGPHRGARVPVEVQLRTSAMHAWAEWGPAAHARFKDDDPWEHASKGLRESPSESPDKASAAAVSGRENNGGVIGGSATGAERPRRAPLRGGAQGGAHEGRDGYCRGLAAGCAGRALVFASSGSGPAAVLDLAGNATVADALAYLGAHFAGGGPLSGGGGDDQGASGVTVNGEAAASDHRLRSGDTLTMHVRILR